MVMLRLSRVEVDILEKKITVNITESLLHRIDWDVEYSNEFLDRDDWICEAIRHYDRHRFKVIKERQLAYGE